MGTQNGASALSASDDWVQAHAALSRLSRERAALDAEEGRWLLRAWRSAANVHLGYGSFAQYVEALTGEAARRRGARGPAPPGSSARGRRPELVRDARAHPRGVPRYGVSPGSTPLAARPSASSRRSWRARPPEMLPTPQRSSSPARACCASRWLPTPSRLSAKRCSSCSARRGRARHVLGGPHDEGAAATRSRSTSAAPVEAVRSLRQASSCPSTQRSSTWLPATRSTSARSCPWHPYPGHVRGVGIEGTLIRPSGGRVGLRFDVTLDESSASITYRDESSPEIAVGGTGPVRIQASGENVWLELESTDFMTTLHPPNNPSATPGLVMSLTLGDDCTWTGDWNVTVPLAADTGQGCEMDFPEALGMFSAPGDCR